MLETKKIRIAVVMKISVLIFRFRKTLLQYWIIIKMFKKLKQLYQEFDEEVLKKDEVARDTRKPDPEAKKQYEKAEFDFKGAR